MNRRGLLLGIGAALAAPAIVRAESIMKVAKLRHSVVTAEEIADVWGSFVAHQFNTGHVLVGADWQYRTYWLASAGPTEPSWVGLAP